MAPGIRRTLPSSDFVGAANIELHRTFAHVFIVLSVLMFAAAFIGQVDGRAKRLTFGLFGLLVVQGMLVHVGQWFGLSMIAALHPVECHGHGLRIGHPGAPRAHDVVGRDRCRGCSSDGFLPAGELNIPPRRVGAPSF